VLKDVIFALQLFISCHMKDDFIEKNGHATACTIEGIHFSSGFIYAFDLFVDRLGKAIYVPERYDESSSWKDTLAATFDKPLLDANYSRLCYIDFPRLKDSYSDLTTDDSWTAVTIKYDGGKTKTIQSQGQIGTHGLVLLYYEINHLRSNQHWIKIGESKHRR